jgi:putative flavoprotein involved in K+ transport
MHLTSRTGIEHSSDRTGSNQTRQDDPVARMHIPTVVIGGGQAGLAMGYHLRRLGEQFVILDAAVRTGDAWRQRWDSLRLFSLPRYASLPGLPIDTTTYPTRDQMADYLETYAEYFQLPIRHRTPVLRLAREGSTFVVETGEGIITADRVVVATGGHMKQCRPCFAADLDPAIRQLDSADYRRPAQLIGDVLVVGAGTAGSDIAIELARGGHTTVLAGPHPGQIPLGLDSRVVRALMPIIMFAFLHVFTLGNPLGRLLHRRVLRRGTPLIRYRRRDIAAAGVRRVGRITDVFDGLPRVDDGTVILPQTVVWCTGFRPDHGWIDLPIFSAADRLMHRRGVVPNVPGLYFLGLSFQHSVSSAALHGLDLDARHLVRAMRRTAVSKAPARDSDALPG